MNVMKKSLTAVAAAAVLGLAGAANASTVDTFEDPGAAPGQRIDAFAGTAHIEYGPGTGIIGGYRDLFIQYSGDGIAGSSMQVAGGTLRFNNESGAGSVGKVTWDGAGGSGNDKDSFAYGLGENLIDQEGCPAGGCDKFLATVLRADAGFQYQIGVYTDADNYSILTADTQFAVNAATSADYDFEWFGRDSGDYNVNGFEFNILKVGDGANFEIVNALQLVINSSNIQDVDLQLDMIGKTGELPEPGSLALAGLALIGAGAARRRLKA